MQKEKKKVQKETTIRTRKTKVKSPREKKERAG